YPFSFNRRVKRSFYMMRTLRAKLLAGLQLHATPSLCRPRSLATSPVERLPSGRLDAQNVPLDENCTRFFTLAIVLSQCLWGRYFRLFACPNGRCSSLSL